MRGYEIFFFFCKAGSLDPRDPTVGLPCTSDSYLNSNIQTLKATHERGQKIEVYSLFFSSFIIF